MSNLMNYSEKIFEDIKHVNEYGQEFWYERELQQVLEYKEWRNFIKIVNKAKITCETSKNDTLDHFVNVNKKVQLGSGAERQIEDIMLSRYACYLIVMNGDPRKEVISLGQTYFAVKTRQQELMENYNELSENQKRLSIRSELIAHNKSLAEAAKMAGVEEGRDYAIFQNYGYKGLYGGLGAKDIQQRKGLKPSQKILDYMGSTELAANLFRGTQTDDRLRREKITGKENAKKTCYEVGKTVRKTIQELGGTMPEDLPTADKSIKQIERQEEQKKVR